MNKNSLSAAYKLPINRYSGPAEVNTSAGLFDSKRFDEKVDENEKWLNTDEAAYYLNITANALRILVHRAKVKTYKLGTRLRFKKSDLFSVLQLKED